VSNAAPATPGIGRVLYVTSSGDTFGGAENALFDIVTNAAEWEPLVVVPFEGELSASLRKAGIHCEVIGLGVLRHKGELRSPVLILRLIGGLIAAARLAVLIRKRRARVVHSNTSAVFAGALAARIARVPHVWHVREVSSGVAWSILGKMIPLLSDRVVCISDTVARNMPSGKRHDRIVVVPDGVDPSIFTYERRRGGSGRVIMASRINPHKGQELFIRAAARVVASVETATFEIIGGFLPIYAALRDRLLALAGELGLGTKLIFSPHMSREEVAHRIAAADVVAVPSTWIEPGGLVVLEAMAMGTSVVATRAGGPAEVIEDGENGFLVSREDPSELASAMTRLLLDQGLRARLTENAHRRVEERYTLALHLARLGAVYREVLGSPQRSRCA